MKWNKNDANKHAKRDWGKLRKLQTNTKNQREVKPGSAKWSFLGKSTLIGFPVHSDLKTYRQITLYKLNRFYLEAYMYIYIYKYIYEYNDSDEKEPMNLKENKEGYVKEC